MFKTTSQAQAWSSSTERSSLAVTVRGGGVSANCCTFLLQEAGIKVTQNNAAPSPVPALLLSDPARALIADIFQTPDIFSKCWRIDQRVVAWGGGEPVAMPHGAVVLSQIELTDALAQPPEEQTTANATNSGEGIAIHATAPFPAGELWRFGHRLAFASPVSLMHEDDCHSCWVESVQEGWLFLVPNGPSTGWLLSIGAPSENLLDQSEYIAGRIRVEGGTRRGFETAPRIASSLTGTDWLACGTSAIAFDPICGDGTAQAVRESILAAAVVKSIAKGERIAPLLRHYESMLLASMRRHLRMCAPFYEHGGKSEWWRNQLSDLAAGFDACTQRLSVLPEPQFILRGLDLLPREAAN